MKKEKRFTVFYNERNNRYVSIFYICIFHEIKILPCFIMFHYCRKILRKQKFLIIFYNRKFYIYSNPLLSSL